MISQVQAAIRSAALKAGRRPEEITLMAVSKTVPPERVAAAFKEGITIFGENRVQELLAKKKDPALAGLPIQWHMIGHLQTNKVKQILGQAELIHSLDRAELAEEINRQARHKKIPFVDCLIQVNSSGEETKQGFEIGEVADFISGLGNSSIRIRGLMTIGPLTKDKEKIRKAFSSVKILQLELRKRVPAMDWSILSMGMSGDYEIAIEEGATLVRLGTAIFGAREKNE